MRLELTIIRCEVRRDNNSGTDTLYSKTLKMVASKVVDLAKWRLVISSHFSKMEGKTLQNGGFFLGKLSNQYCNIIKVYNKLQVRSERTL